MEAKLVVVGGKAQASEYSLRLPMIVGRSRSADLPLSHPLVSRQHCEIFESEGHLMVRDLGSLNGTFVGDSRIQDAALLSPGSLLTIGSVTFRAVYEGSGDMPVADASPDFTLSSDTSEIDQTIQTGPSSANHAPAGGSDGGAADGGDEDFEMSWLNESDDSGPPETEDLKDHRAAAKPAKEAAKPDSVKPGSSKSDGAKSDSSKPASPKNDSGPSGSGKGHGAAPADGLAEPAAAEEGAPEVGDDDLMPPPGQAGEGDDDMDDFFRSLSEP